MRLAFALAAATCAVLAVGVDRAPACSCAIADPHSALAEADAAFVGTLLERREPPTLPSSAAPVTLVFRVEESVKGRLGERVEVETAASGASCGIEVEVGARIGLFLERAGGRWRGSLCGQVAPDRLRAAARGLPRPDGTGPAALLVGGRFGSARMLALDRRGRTLAYGRGAGETLLVSVCPGARRTVELAFGNQVVLAVRALPRLRVVRQLVLPLDRQGSSPAGLWCLDRDAGDVLVFAGALDPRAGSASLLRVRRNGVATAWRGTALAAVARAGSVYLSAGARGNRLLAVELATGRQRFVRRLPASTGSLAVSPDGRRLAGIASGAPLSPTSPPSRLVLVDLARRGSSVRTVALGRSNLTADLVWTAPDRLLVLPRGELDLVRVYDRFLRVRASFHGWQARTGAVVGSTVWGVDYRGRLLAARLPRGPVRAVRRLPSPVAHVLVAV